MKKKFMDRKLVAFTFVAVAFSSAAHAQVPDLLTSFDAGGRALGMGSSIGASGADTFSALNNPAGLAYVENKQFSIAMHNFPQSSTLVNSSFTNPVLDTKGEVGPYGLSHLGVVLPFKRGAIGFSYTVAGYIRDAKTGNGNLIVNATTQAQSYSELIKAKTDMFTVSYGWSNSDQSLALGAGLIVATQYILNRQSYNLVSGGQTIPNPPVNVSGQGTGVGAVVGAQFIPKGSSNVSIGVSVRTPIDLTGNSKTATYYDKIPGKISAGFAVRKDGMRSGDYIVYSGQADASFRNYRSQSLQRKRTVNFGAGVEYSLMRGNARIPIRLGFSVVPKAGDPFKDRNALTFGVGYRPFNSNMSLDLNFASSGSGGFDSSLLLNYRFRN